MKKVYQVGGDGGMPMVEKHEFEAHEKKRERHNANGRWPLPRTRTGKEGGIQLYRCTACIAKKEGETRKAFRARTLAAVKAARPPAK